MDTPEEYLELAIAHLQTAEQWLIKAKNEGLENTDNKAGIASAQALIGTGWSQVAAGVFITNSH